MDVLPIRTVTEIQRMLRLISFYNDDVLSVIPDGIFGNDTAQSVSSFQNAFLIPQTGEVDNHTWNMIVEEYKRILEDEKLIASTVVFDEFIGDIFPGEANVGLYVIQAMLLALSEEFDNIERVYVTGVLDRATEDAVRMVQTIGGITPNGVIDRNFVNVLSRLYNSFITQNHVRSQAAD